MPLDRINGEPFDDRPKDPATGEATGPGLLYDARFVVIEPGDLFRHDIRVSYKLPVAPGKFDPISNPRMGYRHILDDVAAEAGSHFIKAGAIVPFNGFGIDEEDILVQVYPELLKVVVQVQRMIGRREETIKIEYPKTGAWSPEVIRTLLEGAGKKAPVRH